MEAKGLRMGEPWSQSECGWGAENREPDTPHSDVLAGPDAGAGGARNANQGTTAADGRARRRMGNKDCGRPVGKRREAGAGLQAANHRPLRTAGGPAALLGTLGVSVGACEGVFQG